jgi:hypothetical protein
MEPFPAFLHSASGIGPEESTVFSETSLLTYLTGEPGPEVAPPRVGDPVELRLLADGRVMEAYSASGQKLGRVPPDERDAVSGLWPAAPARWSGRITALVPRPRREDGGRIHILVAAG